MEIGTALIAGSVAIVTSAVTALVTLKVAGRRVEADRWLAEQRGKLDRELIELRGRADKELADHKARLEDPYRFALGTALRSAFDDPRYPQRKRSFRRIKQSVAGFTDDEVRRQLHAIGARRITMQDGNEGWHLPPSESVWKRVQCEMRRRRRLPMATWIMASETSMRAS